MDILSILNLDDSTSPEQQKLALGFGKGYPSEANCHSHNLHTTRNSSTHQAQWPMQHALQVSPPSTGGPISASLNRLVATGGQQRQTKAPSAGSHAVGVLNRQLKCLRTSSRASDFAEAAFTVHHDPCTPPSSESGGFPTPPTSPSSISSPSSCMHDVSFHGNFSLHTEQSRGRQGSLSSVTSDTLERLPGVNEIRT